MTHAAYDELARHWTRLHRFGHLKAIAGWDRAAMMPTNGNEARAAAMAEMDGLLHRLRTEPRLAGLLAGAEREGLDAAERANLRELRRDWVGSNAVPEASSRPSRWRRRAANTPGRRSGRRATGPAFSSTCARWFAWRAKKRNTWPMRPASRLTTR